MCFVCAEPVSRKRVYMRLSGKSDFVEMCERCFNGNECGRMGSTKRKRQSGSAETRRYVSVPFDSG